MRPACSGWASHRLSIASIMPSTRSSRGMPKTTQRASSRTGLSLPASCIFFIASALSAAMPASMSPSAFGRMACATKSMAPSSSSGSVVCAPCSVRKEAITTGIGRSRIGRARKSSPAVPGISSSSAMTSGFSLPMIARACSASAAAPTRSTSGWRSMQPLLDCPAPPTLTVCTVAVRGCPDRPRHSCCAPTEAGRRIAVAAAVGPRAARHRHGR